jgi:hypothetical protein
MRRPSTESETTILGTGYHKKSGWDDDFAKIWYANQRRYCPFQERIAVLSTGATYPVQASEINVFYGKNMGHIGDSPRFHGLAGWSASVLALALLAYNCNEDLIYREQDVLAFGPWLQQAYSDLGDADMVFGHKMTTGPWMPCSQSLFIIRHRFLLDFVARYIALGDDSLEFCPEHRFCSLEEQEPERFRRLSFGPERERPLPYDAPVWYAQQITTGELAELKLRHLV